MSTTFQRVKSASGFRPPENPVFDVIMNECSGTDELGLADDAHEELRKLIDTTPALIHTGKADGYLDYFNRGWLNYIGATLEEVCGWRWRDFIHPAPDYVLVFKDVA